jgi:hypothetical protein
VLDSLVFAAEAEIRWLDHCEARVRRAAGAGPVVEEGAQRPPRNPAASEAAHTQEAVR